jgi:hypothetical protein
MIPLAPVPFATLGALCYGELYLGLCRALAAPWLDPWWLAKAGQSDEGQALSPHVTAAPPSQPDPTVSAAAGGRTGATIIPFDRSRATRGRR